MGRKPISGRVNCLTQIPAELNERVLEYKAEKGFSKNEIIRQALEYFLNFHEIAVSDASGEVAAVVSAETNEVIERYGYTIVTAKHPNRLSFREF